MNSIISSGNESTESYAAMNERKATYSLFLSWKENVYNQCSYSLNKLLRSTYEDAMSQIFKLVIPFGLKVHDKPKSFGGTLVKETKIFSLPLETFLYLFLRNSYSG